MHDCFVFSLFCILHLSFVNSAIFGSMASGKLYTMFHGNYVMVCALLWITITMMLLAFCSSVWVNPPPLIFFFLNSPADFFLFFVLDISLTLSNIFIVHSTSICFSLLLVSELRKYFILFTSSVRIHSLLTLSSLIISGSQTRVVRS